MTTDGGARIERDRLRTQSLEGKRAAVAALKAEGTDRSLSLLLELLDDESWSLRDLAVEALTDMADVAAAPLMNRLARGLWFTRAAAARALGRMSHAPALLPILRMLDDPNHTIATEAAQALVEMSRRDRAAAVARGILARGADAEAGFAALERIDPDAGRKIRILGAREDVAAPILAWLEEERPDPEVLNHRLRTESDSTLGIRWADIFGPVTRERP